MSKLYTISRALFDDLVRTLAHRLKSKRRRTHFIKKWRAMWMRTCFGICGT